MFPLNLCTHYCAVTFLNCHLCNFCWLLFVKIKVCLFISHWNINFDRELYRWIFLSTFLGFSIVCWKKNAWLKLHKGGAKKMYKVLDKCSLGIKNLYESTTNSLPFSLFLFTCPMLTLPLSLSMFVSLCNCTLFNLTETKDYIYFTFCIWHCKCWTKIIYLFI